jgi:hypothetical protein
MLMLSKSLLNRPVMSLRSGSQIAVATEPLINPHNLKIMGWWCKSAGGQTKVLLAEDIRELIPNGLAVNDEDDLSLPEDLVRHKEVLEIAFQKLYVARPLRKVFTTDDTVIIDRTQILEVTDHYILVRDTEIHATADELAGAAVTA